jgi:TolB-like protein/tRNA A-37 threonylcarbamoyl transferase component Bud32/tetratricopeptide (TPR) repeat protein
VSTNDLREHLQQTLGSSYCFERELGGGGMSRVFLAEDRVLGRDVVVKVLSPAIAADLSAERFSREIKMAARLQQANIVPVLSTGEADGLPYYTMPFVEGQSLRHRLATKRPLTIHEVVNILRDVARALDYAHGRGVIHRDIKPENVLLSGEAAVVTDFGIAKAIADSRAHSAHEMHDMHDRLTTEGTVVGTPTYIAPEQAVGDPNTDHRADIYAFGCLAYELLAGRPPFTGTPQHVFAAHVNDAPAALESIRRDVPPSLAALVMKCLAKDPRHRPQSARDVLRALDEPLGAILRSRPIRTTALAVFVLAATAGIVAHVRSVNKPNDGTPRTLAVMPFANIGGDSTQDYFADGMATDLTNALGRVGGLRVASRSLAFGFKGKPIDVRQAGRELGVDAILEGTVQRVGPRVRVTAQLTRAGDGISIWNNTYERDAKDIFRVQDAITKSIVDELRPALGEHQSTSDGNVAGTTDFEAYNAYLRGVFLLEHRGPGVASSVGYFKQAITLDSSFARAYGMLSNALELLPYFTPTPAASIERDAMNAARTALRLDSTVVDAHIGLALALDHEFKWDEAEREYLAATRLDSLNSTAHLQYGRHLMNRGRTFEALTEFKRAAKTDPLSGTALAHVAHMLSLSGKLDSSMVVYRRAREVDPGLILGRTMGARDAIAAGDTALARSLAAGVEGSPPWRGQAAYALAKLGDVAPARAALRQLDTLPRSTWMVHTGTMYVALGLGDTTRALAQLDSALRAGEIVPKWETFTDRMFDGIRKSARFAAAVRGFNLDVAFFAAPPR